MIRSLLPLLVGCANVVPAPVDPPLLQVWEHGADVGLGNVVALQAWMQPLDYAEPDRLDERLRGWLDEADDLGMLRDDTVVVLPEYVGTWLVALDEKAKVFEVDEADKALKKVVMSSLWEWMAAKKGVEVDDRATYGLFALKADRMAEVYTDVMTGIAVDYGVTLVPGSILLPGTEVRGGRITATAGEPLRNASFVIAPDGSISGPIVKSFPTEDEQGFVTAGDPDDLPVVDTPIGRLGVLVCADAWFPEAWDAVSEADVVVVPQFTAGEGTWTDPWHGYSGWPEPDDVDLDDIDDLTEAEAWVRYGPSTRSAEVGVPFTITAPLRGRLWDLGTDGQARLRSGEVLAEGPYVDAPVLLNAWIGP